MLPPTDFKSVASADSATLAYALLLALQTDRNGESATPQFLTKLKLEAAPRLELGVKVLQTSALPLGYAAI